MGLFYSGNKPGNSGQDHFRAELQDTERRLEVFLGKLDERLDLLLSGFVEEAPAVREQDDRYEQAYNRFCSAMRGQVKAMQKKVQEVREQQVETLFYAYLNAYPIGSSASRILGDWRIRCIEKIERWESELRRKQGISLEQVESRDYEPVFQRMLDEYREQCAVLKCRQCGAKLDITQVYRYTVYVACGFCQTQNIFNPGSAIGSLEDIARKLAEQRSKHILIQHERMKTQERERYHEMHALKLSMGFDRHSKDNEQTWRLEMLEVQWMEAQKSAPELLDRYYRNVFDELTNLLPDLKEHHEKFYNSIRTNYFKRVVE